MLQFLQNLYSPPLLLLSCLLLRIISRRNVFHAGFTPHLCPPRFRLRPHQQRLSLLLLLYRLLSPTSPKKEPYISAKESYVSFFSTSTTSFLLLLPCRLLSPASPQKSPIFLQKSPVFLQKSPIFQYLSNVFSCFSLRIIISSSSSFVGMSSSRALEEILKSQHYTYCTQYIP